MPEIPPGLTENPTLVQQFATGIVVGVASLGSSSHSFSKEKLRARRKNRSLSFLNELSLPI